jgi:AAA family ATP:ADP antiporter
VPGAPLLAVSVRQAAVASGVLSALTVTGKSTRDALFCAHFPATELPKAMLAGAALSASFALGTSRIFRRHGPAAVLPALMLVNAVGFLIEHALLAASPKTVALVLYLHVPAVTGLLLSGFWSVVNERFDPHSLRLSISRIGLGGTLGGFIGGVTAERIAAWAGARHTLLELAVLSVLAAASVRSLGVGVSTPRSEAPAQAPVASSYLYELGAFVALTALCSSVVDFAFKAEAMQRYTSAEDLMQFFAVFYTGMNLLGFVLQATLTPRLLDSAGLGVGLGGHPSALAVAAAVALAAPGLTMQALLRAADGALVPSLFRSSYEPLYTPLAPERKRATKAVIDVLVNRAGDALGGFIAWGLVLVIPYSATTGANLAVAIFAIATFALALRLRQGYVAELRESLLSGAVVLDESGVSDQTTRLTLSRTLTELNRERLLAEIERQRAGSAAKLEAAPSTPPAGAAAPLPRAGAARPGSAARAPAELVGDLTSSDPKRIESALDAAELQLAPFVIPLIAREDVGAKAMNTLRRFGARVIGQLADVMLDAEGASPTVRRRLVRVIATTPSPWAAAALSAALEDPDFDVRRQVVRGLEEMAESGVQSPIERAPALTAAARELGGQSRVSRHDRVDHVMRLLGLSFDREAFRLARLALDSDDTTLRGTALEYLDNVLPSSIKTPLFEQLAPGPARKSARLEHELIDELRRTLA